MVGTSLAAAWLAYAFPEPPRRGRSALRLCMLVLTVAAVVVAIWLAIAPAIGADTRALRHVAMRVFTRSLALLAVAVFLRLRGTSGRERAELRSAIGGLLFAPALIVVGLVHGGALFYLILPCLVGCLPLSIGNALIRHNILATTAVLTRRLFVVPTVLVAFVGAVFAWRIADAVVARGNSSILVAVALGAVFLLLFSSTRRLWLRWFFPAASRFRPTIEQLSDELTSLRDRAALRRAIEDVVSRWLPTREVRVLEESELGRVEHLSGDARERLRAGERVWTLEHPWQRQLLVPMRSQGELRAILQVAPKHQAALYTSEDMVLLETIAGFGAVALHNIEVAGQLAALRRSELDAARDDKRLAIGLIGAEVSHEIAYSLNFFRYLLRTGAGSRELAEQDLEIGREEVERLQRMLSALRKLQASTPQLQTVQLQRPLLRAVDLLRESVEEQRVRLTLEVPPDLSVVADADSLVQLFSNLLRNALQAAGSAGDIGVRSFVGSDGLVVDVWDSGPGISDDIKSSIFNPWVTTKKDGTGLGLAISQRIVRSLGWTIDVGRADGRTCFRLRVPGLPKPNA
jgi:signal transduction histidine kinase